MRLVSVGSTRHTVNVWIKGEGSATEPMALSHREAVSLARHLLSAVETYMPDDEEGED
jgi:hypothetical protein